jgi:phage-related baseplate assembly protein
VSEITFVQTNTDTIKANIIAVGESVLGRKLAPADPLRLFLEGLASIIVEQRALIDHMAKMNMLAYATGVYLDVLGELVGTKRLSASSAATMMRFTLSSVQPGAVIIPAGTRVTPNGTLMFNVKSTVQINAGDTVVDVEAVCATAGEGGNGFLPGEIKTLVDPIAYVASVQNISTTVGGSDTEDDESYRQRIADAPGQFSVAGPDDAYIYWAKTAHASITDVAVESPEGGDVYIYVLTKGGTPAATEILNAVNETCSDKNKRPLTDRVYVKAPSTVSYNVQGAYYIDTADASRSTDIQNAVKAAVADYVAWQKEKLGRDINPSELIHKVIAAGAKRVELTAPVFATVKSSEVAAEGTVALTLGGLEDG